MLCGWYTTVGAKELNMQLEAMNEVEPVIGNTIKPTRGTIGKENPNLGRRTVAQKAIVPTTSMWETRSSKGTMKPHKDVERYKMPIAHPRKLWAPTLFEMTIM